MKYFKKISKITFIIMTVAIMLTGCSKEEISTVRTSDAKEALDLFNKYNVEDNVSEMVKLYSDVYFDYVGDKTTDLIKMIQKSRSGVDITKAEVKSMEDIDDNTKKAVVTITSVQNGKEISKDYVYALLKNDNGWSVSPDGVINNKDFNIPAIENGKLNLTLTKQIKVFDGDFLKVNLINDTNKEYIFGKEGELSEVVVETSEGTYNTKIDQVVPVSKRSQTYFMSGINGMKGEVNKVTITGVYEGDGSGNPKEDTKQDIVIYNK